jgi:pimeloyl-ACP methyl ester carboxylesterase
LRPGRSDHVQRLAVQGARRLAKQRLAGAPAIAVPTITMEGDANGAPHAPATAYRSKFTGKYEHRSIAGGVGHNLPQEAPQAFAKAIADIAG